MTQEIAYEGWVVRSRQIYPNGLVNGSGVLTYKPGHITDWYYNRSSNSSNNTPTIYTTENRAKSNSGPGTYYKYRELLDKDYGTVCVKIKQDGTLDYSVLFQYEVRKAKMVIE